MATTQAQRDACKRYRKKHPEVGRAYNRTEKRKLYAKQYYLSHKDKYAAQSKRWQKANRAARVEQTLRCREKNKDGYRAYMKQWNAEHAELKKQYRVKWKKEKPGYYKEYYERNKHLVMINNQKQRARRMLAATNLRGIKNFRDAVKSKEFAFCYYCDRRFPSSIIHFEHIIPLIQGGSHSVENLCVSCPDCNWSKGAKTLSQWKRDGQQILNL